MRIIMFFIGICPMAFWGNAQVTAQADAELMEVAVSTNSDNELEINIMESLVFSDYSLILEQQVSRDIWKPYLIIKEIDYEVRPEVECGYLYRAMLVDQKEVYKPIFLRNKQYSNEVDMLCRRDVASDLVVYPNPASTTFSLGNPALEDFSLRIFSAAGELIKSYTNSNQHQFDISQLNAATYVIELITKDNQIYTAQLQKI